MPDERLNYLADPVLPRLDADEAGYISQDLSQLRDLVMRGDHLAVAGGSIMIWWGLVLAITHGLHAAISASWLREDVPVDWLAIIFGACGSLGIWRFSKRRYFFNSWRTQAISTLWLFAGLGIFVFLVGSQLTHVAEPHITMAFMAIVFSLVMAVVATSARQPWLYGVAVAWMMSACAMFMLDHAVSRFILMSVASVLLMAVPGLVLLRAEWRAHPKENIV
ncbi:MAG: hypothetical protein WBQ60_08075 [Asticcacaulis sp.]